MGKISTHYFLILYLLLCSCSSAESQKNLFQVTKKLDIPATSEALDEYLEKQLAIGSVREEVFESMRPIEPKYLAKTKTLGGFPESTTDCFIIRLSQLVKHRTLDRLLCFDEQDQVIWSGHLIGFE